eukprot:m51a1_g14435 hypothetical protein (338) ;mRNA; r:537865-541333
MAHFVDHVVHLFGGHILVVQPVPQPCRLTELDHLPGGARVRNQLHGVAIGGRIRSTTALQKLAERCTEDYGIVLQALRIAPSDPAFALTDRTRRVLASSMSAVHSVAAALGASVQAGEATWVASAFAGDVLDRVLVVDRLQNAQDFLVVDLHDVLLRLEATARPYAAAPDAPESQAPLRAFTSSLAALRNCILFRTAAAEAIRVQVETLRTACTAAHFETGAGEAHRPLETDKTDFNQVVISAEEVSRSLLSGLSHGDMPVDVLYMLRVAELMAVTDCKGAPRQPPANPQTIHGNSCVSPCSLRTTSELGLCATLPVLALKTTEGIAVLLTLRHPEV